jgi:creatinine amidohydrolase
MRAAFRAARTFLWFTAKGDERMKKNPLEVQHLTGSDFKAAPFDKVILPLGSLESHGGHLPFGTDAMTAHLIALDIAAKLPRTAVLPPLNYGVSEHYKMFPFTVSVSFDTEIAFLHDILESVYREGIRKVFIMNGHDGNISPIEVASRTVKVAHHDMKIVSLDAWWMMIGDLLPPDFFAVWNGLGHAGEGETSICLEPSPSSVTCRRPRAWFPGCRSTSTSSGASTSSRTPVPRETPRKGPRRRAKRCARPSSMQWSGL